MWQLLPMSVIAHYGQQPINFPARGAMNKTIIKHWNNNEGMNKDAKEFNEALITYQIWASKSLALSMSTVRSSSPMLSSHGISQERLSLTPADSSSFEVGVPRGVNIWFEVRGTDLGLTGSKDRLTSKPHAPLRNSSVHYFLVLLL